MIGPLRASGREGALTQPGMEPMPADARRPVELSIVMPCLDEAATVATCIRKAQRYLTESGIDGEVVIADNGSTDDSPAIARSLGARVVNVETKGYGSALSGGIAAARGRFIIMGDADDSYDFSNLSPFVAKLREGYDLVMGNRFTGGILPGAMPPLHRFVGNPLLTAIGRVFFRSPCGDFHCGLRGIRKDSAARLDLRTTGMEFATEMIVKATLAGLRIAEVPTSLAPDGRSRHSHLRSWHDGWRHLRFLLLLSPRWLFLVPGTVLIVLGLVLGLWLLPGPRRVGSVVLDVHTLLYAAACVLVGFQGIVFAAFTKVFAVSEGLLPPDRRLETLVRHMTLEVGLLAGLFLLAAGLAGSIYAFADWQGRSFGPLDPSRTFRIIVPAVTMLTLGAEVIFASFFLSVLRLGRR